MVQEETSQGLEPIAPEGQASASLRRDLADRVAAWIDGIPPYGWEALVIACAAITVASFARAAAGWSGPDLRLATYFPAILGAGLLAGLPAGFAVTVVSGVIVWWAFTAPYFEFKPLIASDQIAFGMYAAAAGCTLLFAHWCRLMLRQLLRQQRMNEIITRELEHRGRNLFALFEVIVQKTLPHDPASAQKILGRLRSLRFANELLTNPTQKLISLRELVEFEFASMGESRFTVFARLSVLRRMKRGTSS